MNFLSLKTPLCAFFLALLLTGLAARIAPLFDRGGRLFRQFPTEDGYVMLTIARNMALGRGMSISDGEVMTNGTQPLVTFLWALCFSAAGNDKAAGVRLVLIVSIAISICAAWLILLLGRKLLTPHQWAFHASAAAALIWFASPHMIRHTMNCQETGAYMLAVLGSVLVFLRWREDRPDFRFAIVMGAMLGLAFWIRNDVIFLVFACCFVRILPVLKREMQLFSYRTYEVLICGGIAFLIGLPWLVFNHRLFGSIVPISGIKEGMNARFAQNLYLIPSKFFEFLTVIEDVPPPWEESLLAVSLCTIVVLASAIAVTAFVKRAPSEARCASMVIALFGIGIVGYYGLFFNAPYFMSRFLSPLSPILAIVSVGAATVCVRHLWRKRWGRVIAIAPALLLSLIIQKNYRGYRAGTSHEHFQVVEWVQKHVPDDVWIGGIQSGTIGFFHDRTVNLDGKIDPNVLRSKFAHRHHEYILETPIQYLVDWVGIETWLSNPAMAEQFELLVKDEEKNLAVLKRRAPRRENFRQIENRLSRDGQA